MASNFSVDWETSDVISAKAFGKVGVLGEWTALLIFETHSNPEIN